MRKTNQIRINKKDRIRRSIIKQTSKPTATRWTHKTSNLPGHKSGLSEMAASSRSILALTTWPLSIELTQLWMLILGIIAIIYRRRAVCNTLTPCEMASRNRLTMRSTGSSNLSCLPTIIKSNIPYHHSQNPATALISRAMAYFSLIKKHSLQQI